MAGADSLTVAGEAATSGGPGTGVVQHVIDHWVEQGWL